MGNLPSKPASGSWRCGRPDCGHGQGTKISLHFLLIGRTGDGKSSTGNFILDQKPFPTSGATNSRTKKVKVAWAQHGCYDIKIVDGPGLKDTDLSITEEAVRSVENMAKALILCNGGVHAFLLVVKLGQRFTLEMKETISDLRVIFGDNYLRERTIIVVTGGEGFVAMMERDKIPCSTFDEWIRLQEQNRDFKRLVEECSSRILLFNNFTKDERVSEVQRKKLFALAEELGRRGTYTSQHFNMYRDIRQRLEQRNGPLFKEDLQKNVHLFVDGIADLLQGQSPTLQDVDCLKAVIDGLLSNVRGTDDVGGTLQEIKEHLETMGPLIDKLKLAIERSDAVKVQSQLNAMRVKIESLKTAANVPWGQSIVNFLGEAWTRFASLFRARESPRPARENMASALSNVGATFLRLPATEGPDSQFVVSSSQVLFSELP